MNKNDLILYGTVYWIRNRSNNKFYIGQTTLTLENRWRSHVADSCINASCAIDRAIAKYGPKNFDRFEIQRVCVSQVELDQLEDFYIDFFDATNREFGYNIRRGGSHGRHNESTKNKLADFRKGKTWEQLCGVAKAYEMKEHLKKTTAFRIQQNRHVCIAHSVNTKKKIGNSNRGKLKNRVYVTNGIVNRRISLHDSLPSGFRLGRTISEEHKRSLIKNVEAMNQGKQIREAIPKVQA